jgi:hypothetical protein
VALDQSITLELCERHTVFAGLVLPHSSHGIGATLPEAINKLGVPLEMVIQRRPMSSDRGAHGGESPNLNSSSRFVRHQRQHWD